MNLFKRQLPIVTVILFALFSCKKNDLGNTDKQEVIENPLVRKDAYFPNGVLQFNSTASFKSFYENTEKDPNYANRTTNGFKTFKVHIDEYNLAKSVTTSSAVASSASNATSSDPLEVDSTEFINDMKSFMLPVDNLANVVNPEMEVIVADTLYQFTRIGLFKANLSSLSDYLSFYESNKNNIFFDSSYIKTPNETLLIGDEYLVQQGITRTDDASNDILASRVQYIDDGGGYPTGGGGTGGGGAPGGSIPDYYVNSTVGASFDKEVGIVFNDWAKRRLVFKTQKIDIAIAGFGFHKIDIKAKIQREKKFLWITYWGPSNADEIIVGCDNMSLETDYIFPHPQQFSTITRPTFEGLADFEIGNWVVHTLNLKVNYSALGYTLNNAEVASFVNKQFNSVVGNVYNNAFKLIETKLINSIDPTYLSTYANYTKKVNELDNQYRLKWVIGKAEKPEGYSHQNTWTFDWNIGGSWTQGGGVGGYPSQYHYNYDMKSGSFFGRARVGSVWHGIRIVRI
ncbi:MAG TPA: hypothetical protein PKA77_01515 [Chitinophagaceae bacterium]|nr:hypothetical protein [Chitinophagaceae bacterium]HMU57307.1 hypothetical protein [Chitinophagaceae bacterium]